MYSTITFNKIGYDPFLDFIKAYAIIFVILAHSLPIMLMKYSLFYVWADMQVPIFILIQTFHSYKKGYAPTINWMYLIKRIIVPFVFTQGLLIFILLLFSNESQENIVTNCVKAGGCGPGSYYFWIYLQMAFILVLLFPLVKKLSRLQLLLYVLLFSVGCEVLFSLIDLPDAIYRLLAFRYLFLIPLAFYWIDNDVKINTFNVLLSVISIVAVIFFSFSDVDLEPLFYNTGWKTHRWICYFYLPILLTYVLWGLYNILKEKKWLFSIIKEIAKSSYEIYLVQMMVFVLVPINRLIFIQSDLIRTPIWIILTFVLSITGGIILNKIVQNLLLKR